MCEAKPGVRCASDTCTQATTTLEDYIRAWPGGARVDTLAAMQAVIDVAGGPAPEPRVPSPPMTDFGDTHPVHGPFTPEDGAWNVPDPACNTVTAGGITFRKREPGTYACWPDAIRVEVGRPVTNEEMRRLAGIVGYTQRSVLRGREGISGPFRDGPNSFYVLQDATKTASDDYGHALAEFEDVLPSRLAEGTPVRKTDRAGAGTSGTRLVNGVPDLGGVSIWYDDVVSHVPAVQPESRTVRAPSTLL